MSKETQSATIAKYSVSQEYRKVLNKTVLHPDQNGTIELTTKRKRNKKIEVNKIENAERGVQNFKC